MIPKKEKDRIVNNLLGIKSQYTAEEETEFFINKIENKYYCGERDVTKAINEIKEELNEEHKRLIEKIEAEIDKMIKEEWKKRDSCSEGLMKNYYQTRLNFLGVEIRDRILKSLTEGK